MLHLVDAIPNSFNFSFRLFLALVAASLFSKTSSRVSLTGHNSGAKLGLLFTPRRLLRLLAFFCGCGTVRKTILYSASLTYEHVVLMYRQ